MDKWIKCNDRMPSENMDVWFSAKSHPNFPFLGHFENKQFYSRERCPFGNVTHWMPFERPLPPEPEESELVKYFKENTCTWVAPIESSARNMVIGILKQYEREHSK